MKKLAPLPTVPAVDYWQEGKHADKWQVIFN